MSQEGAAKLRLKPRKAPPACSRELSPGRESPRRRRVSAGSCSWFEREDLNECEKTWLLLLKNVSQDVLCTNGQTVPSFPAFLGQSSEEETLQNQEIFTVGMKNFQWVSFPAFPKEKYPEAKDLNSPEGAQSQREHSHQGQGQADAVKSLPSPAEKTRCGTPADHTNTVGEDTKGISKLGLSPESHKLTEHRSATHPVALSQSSAEAFSLQQFCRGTVQSSGGNGKGGGREEPPTPPGAASVGEGRAAPAQQPLASAPGAESCRERAESQSGASSTLDSCPMCLMGFAGTLSQLDIDGHLARCLSESADDVVW